jgi:hypothetical protein
MVYFSLVRIVQNQSSAGKEVITIVECKKRRVAVRRFFDTILDCIEAGVQEKEHLSP